jgi:hypothetical protein
MAQRARIVPQELRFVREKRRNGLFTIEDVSGVLFLVLVG